MKRTLTNISERNFFATLLQTFQPIVRLSTMEWGRKYRVLSSTESTINVGEFDPNIMPYMEYVYDCLDSPYIPTITSIKSARIGWTEVINTWLGNRIHNKPCQMLLGFATLTQARKFTTGKWKEYVKNTPVLRKRINVGVAKNKENMFHSVFPNGSLLFSTLGSIISQKGDNIPLIIIEEPDDVKDDVSGQGDSFKNLEERMKLVPKTQRKFIFGGTGTDKDFSRVEKAVKKSNMLIFKACCHGCQSLIPMDTTAFDCLKWDDFENRYIDPIYGKENPETARFECPVCQVEWSFEQKTLNIIEGKKYGFTDHTGNFSKGWHPKNPNVTEVFGFIFSELLSTFKDGSDYKELAKDWILAKIDMAKGNEAPMKSFVNNRRGDTYASGFSTLEADEMVQLRSNYPEHIIPYEGLIPFCGIDVQHTRFAIIILAAGRNGNIYLVSWFEIFGNVFNWEDPVWQKLTDIVTGGVTHVTGKILPIECTSIDCQDGKTAELVYRWVAKMNNELGKDVRATRGCKDLKYSIDDIYQEPRDIFASNDRSASRSLAETMGVPVYPLGTHRCQDEILRRIALNKNKDETGQVISKHDVFYFSEQTYGGFEEQMTSCRKLIDTTASTTKEVYRLIPGKHMDTMAATKNAVHAMYAKRVREFTDEKWKAIERYIYE